MEQAKGANERRLTWFARLLAISMLVCVLFSWRLWIARPFYPLVPLFAWLPEVDRPWDIFLFATLLIAILATALLPRARSWRWLVIGVTGTLFVLDQSRLWPSFYQYSLMYVVLATWRSETSDAGEREIDAANVLGVMQLIIAFIYIWAGIHKLNPYFFTEEFPWFIEPALAWFGEWREAFTPKVVSRIACCSALFEVVVGVGLLTHRFRFVSLLGATLIHLVILGSIGPLRDHWNNGSWLWGQTVLVMVWFLFFRTEQLSWRSLSDAIWRFRFWRLVPIWLVVVMPFFNGLNLWDSGLSFNVYTGNKDYAEIHLRPGMSANLPAEIARFVEPRADYEVLNLVAWSLHEFHANPFPESRIYKTIMSRVCEYLPPDSARLYISRKAKYFSEKRVIVISN